MPYRGIRPFRYVDHPIFFAREQEEERLASLVSVYRGVMLYGGSGTGKSSLINAGLLPRAVELGFAPERVRVQPRVGEELVVERIATADDGSEPLPSLLVEDDDAARVVLSTESFERRVRAACDGLRPLLVFDQFEELCTLFDRPGGEHARERIVELLVRLLHGPLPVKLLFVFREDYLGRVKQLLSACPELVDQGQQLAPLAADDLPTIIRGPFERHPGHFGHELSPALAEQLRRALDAHFATDGLSLSEVQSVCLRLWRSSDPDGLLSTRGVQGLLEDDLGEALDAFPPRVRFAAVALLGQMVTAAGTRNVISAADLVQRVREEDPSASREELQLALSRLERESRLVRRERRRDLDLYEITSEFLVPWISRRREQARRQRERARERRRVVLLGALAGALGLVAVAVTVLALLALDARDDARRSAARATALGLAGVSRGQHDERADVSLLLALGAYETDQGQQERDVLVTALEAARRSGAVGILHGHGGAAVAVAYSPDGSVVASGGFDHAVRLWDVRSHRQLGALEGHDGTVVDLAFGPDGRTIASAGADGTLRLWDVRAHRQIARFPRSHAAFTSIAFSPDGRTIASGDYVGRVRLWDVRSRRPSGPPLFDRHEFVEQVAFSPDGRLLASAGDDGTIRLWDVARRRAAPGPRFRRLDQAVNSVAFSPDGRTIASGGDDRVVRLWSVASRRQTRALRGHTRLVYRVAFGPDGRTLVSVGYDGVTRVWDATARGADAELAEPVEYLASDVAFSPDGRTLALAGWNGTVELVRPRDPHRFGTPLPGRTRARVNDLAFSPDGQTLASASWDDTVRLWDVAARRPRGRPLTGHSLDVEGVAFSQDGQTLASAGDDHTVQLWDVASHRRLTVLRGHTKIVNAVAFSPRGGLLASVARDGTIRLWDVARRRPAPGARFPRLGGSVNAVAFRPDGQLLATAGSDDLVRLWDVASRRQVALLRGHSDGVSSIAFSPDGRLLATASYDGTARLWDVAARRQLHGDLVDHRAQVNDVAFGPGGDELATAGDDYQVRLWDAAFGVPLGTPLDLHRDTVASVALSPDGTTVASADTDGTIRLWDGFLWRGRAAPREAACRLVGGDLSRGEWARYVPGIPYRRICAG